MHFIFRRLISYGLFIGFLLSVGVSSLVAQESKPVLIGLDGEFGHVSSTSAEAIRQGIQIAIDEINLSGGVLHGRPLKLVEKANQSLPARSFKNIEEFAALPDLVAVYCGRFSPTVLETLPLIHKLRIPLLDPWAAADEIIDNHYQPSYVFRLSLKDSWAADVMLSYLEQRNLKRIGLLMLNTSWGRSTKRAAENYANQKPDISIVATQWINWDDKEDSMLAKYKQLRTAGAQAILLTANAEEGAILSKVMLGLPESEQVPIASHWGVTGGHLPELVGEDFYKLDFRVVQTYSFIGQESLVAMKVISAYNKKVGGEDARSIISPVGVAHAYDLTHILALAIDLAGSTNRDAIRDALEKIPAYSGLIKQYLPPFTKERHEALSESEVFMAKYAPLDGALERQP
ncbi:MAG: ABC transporter substrate-binding protein [Gammaproteobacteria bacterium]|nr:ABC transporter substrate-binding protein [Gammaproteobacteria bacterium]MCP5196738.1 ABC transporter substrate-binding protein [Gammaproteobacteria bacterium]